MEAIQVQKPLVIPWAVTDRWKKTARRVARMLRIRSRIQEFEHVDPATGETTYLTVTKKFAVLSCGDEQWYFDKYRRA